MGNRPRSTDRTGWNVIRPGRRWIIKCVDVLGYDRYLCEDVLDCTVESWSWAPTSRVLLFETRLVAELRKAAIINKDAIEPHCEEIELDIWRAAIVLVEEPL